MTLSPPYPVRADMPHNPTPSLSHGFHWPTECVEVFSHPWLRVWQCPHCRQGHELRADEAQKVIGMACYGDGACEVYEE
jgi:hypothetical protein